MADKIVTDTQNQRLYLENLVKSGDTGQQMWAKDQLTNFDNLYTDSNNFSQSQPQSNTSMDNMMNMLGMMSGAYVQQQQGMLEAARQNQFTNLQKAYSDAVAQGRMSVRDAEQQFNEQSQSINQSAYQDAERTKLYGQDMGISNSQQMVGLMQGDDARKNSLINQNMTMRDKRINDIKDRVNAITTQRDLDVANVNAQYDAGMQQAMGTAMSNMTNNMFNVMQGDYTANRNHQRALELNDIEYEQAKEMMDVKQRQTLELVEKEHGYAVAKTRLSASLDAQMREAQKKAELEMLYRAYNINPNDPDAPQKLRLRQNAEPAVTEVDVATAFTAKPSLPEPASIFDRFKNMLNPFSDKEYVYYKDGNYYNKSNLNNQLGIIDAIDRQRRKYGIE